MHYFQQLIPPLAFLAGVGLSSVLKWALPFQRVLGLTVIGISLGVFLVVEGPLFFAKPSAGMWELYQRTGYVVATPAAEYIRSHSAPGDTIYVAFYQADIYYLSQRQSSSIYLFRLDLLYIPNAYSSVVKSIQQHEPTYILDMNQSLGATVDTSDFYRALYEGYQVEATFDGAKLYRRK